jgi:hypothetical protein
MDTFERNMKGLISNLRQYSLLEFYHEESHIKKSIRSLSEQLEHFDLYLPKSAVIIENAGFAKSQIKIDLKERINSYVTKVDHSFSL